MATEPGVVPDHVKVAVDRYHHLFDLFGQLEVNCSGGMDSTCIIETGVMAARERGRKLDVVFIDEEIVATETLAYMHRLARRPELNVHWIYGPIKLGLVSGFAGNNTGYWHCWHPSEKWCREPPEFAKKIPDTWYGKSINEVPTAYLRGPSVVGTMGVRRAESMARRTRQSLVSKPTKKRPFCRATPIVDWSNNQTYEAVHLMGWDWNRAYMHMFWARMPRTAMRIGPPLGEEPSNGIKYLARWDPGMWRLIVEKFPGCAEDMRRYASTALYGRGRWRNDAAQISPSDVIAHTKLMPEDRRRRAVREAWKYAEESLAMGKGIDVKRVNRLLLKGGTKEGRSRTQQRIGLMMETGRWTHGGKKKMGHLKWLLQQEGKKAAKRKAKNG